jgi:hypothetical protein
VVDGMVERSVTYADAHTGMGALPTKSLVLVYSRACGICGCWLYLFYVVLTPS